MEDRALVSAQRMGLAVTRDPEFQLPQRPRFLTGLVTIPLGGGLLVEGAAERQVFRGREALSLLPRLIALLDGSRTIGQLADEMPDITPTAIHDAVSLLYTRGVLEDAAADDEFDLAGISPDLLAYCRRLVDVTRSNRSGAQVLHRLASARVVISGQRSAGQLLADELVQYGLSNVHVGDVEDLSVPVGTDLVVALADHEGLGGLLSVDDACAKAGVPWLHVGLFGSVVEIGPYFDREFSACYECFRASCPPSASVKTQATPWRRQMAIALAANEVVNIISQLCVPLTTQEYVQFRLDDWTQQRNRLVRLPGCPTCLPIHGQPRGEAVLPHAFEQAVSLPPRRYVVPKQHQGHYRVVNLALTKDGKRYPGASKVALLPMDQAPAPAGNGPLSVGDDGIPPRQRLDVALLSGLLQRVGGLRPTDSNAPSDRVQRWIPSGGNLGSVQIYLLVRDVTGLAPGCYFYQHNEHALARLEPQRTSYEVERLIAQTCPDLPPDFAAAFVLTGALARVRFKYESFGYRVILFDAGVAVAQAQALATGYGLRLTVGKRWHDRELSKELGLSGELEPITTTFALCGGR